MGNILPCCRAEPKIIWIFISFAISYISWGFTWTLFPQYLTQRCGGNISVASKFNGDFQATTALASFATSALLGVLSDRYGRKPFALLGIVRKHRTLLVHNKQILPFRIYNIL